MKNKKIYLTCGVMAIVILILWSVFYNPVSVPSTPEVIVKEPEQIEETPTVVPFKQSKHYVKPETVPASFGEFYEMHQSVRLRNVTRFMKNDAVHHTIIDFFKSEIFNRKHKEIIRNNMANTLCWQKVPDPDLHLLFIKMLDDEEETPKWRDYCIQFLTECYPSSSDKPLIIETIKKYSEGDDSKAGTAILHLALNGQKVDSKSTLSRLEDPTKTSIHTRTTILAVWGKTKDKSQLPTIRKYATQDKIASLKATAIGTLGLIGEEEDLLIINKALYHTNGRVVLAARAAKKKIEARMAEISK